MCRINVRFAGNFITMDDLRNLISFDGFERAFWHMVSSGEYHSQEAAFDALNDRFFDWCGEYRFPSFDAFRVKRDRRAKRVLGKSKRIEQ